MSPDALKHGALQIRSADRNMIPMGLRITTGLAAAFAVIACQPGLAAGAETSDCLWNALPARTRTALVGAYLREGANGLASVHMTDEMIRGAARTCHAHDLAPERLRMVGAAVAGATLWHGAAQGLAASGISPTRLNGVWRRAIAQRQKLLALILGPEDSIEGDRQLFATISDLARLAGQRTPAGADPRSDPLFKLYADYFRGRAQAEAYPALTRR